MHAHPHAFAEYAPHGNGGVVLGRRNLFKLGLGGVAGLSLPSLLRATPGKPKKSVILLWMAGGPSQIDTLDPKPDRPEENRGPFGTVATKLPGVRICEHLPNLAARSGSVHGHSFR